MSHFGSPDGFSEFHVVLRRLIALLATVFVLSGSIAPSLACAMQMGSDDCCPAGSGAPCHEDPLGSVPGTAVVCCAPSSQAASASVSVSREQAGQLPDHIGSADPLIAAVWLATLTPSWHLSSPPPRTLVFVSGAGELTYLRTMRLRL